MVTGKPPFRKPTKADTISAILNEDPPAISQFVPNTPPGLQKVVHRCLEKSPEQRFQSASDLAFALGALSSAHEERLQGLGDVKIAPDEANKESESSAVAAARTRAPSTTWWRWWLAAVVMCSLVAALLWSLYPRPKTPARALKAVALTSNVGNEGFPTFSPDGNQVAFSWDGAKQENIDIYVKLIGPGSPLRLTTDPAADIGPAWSPDGRTIAFLRELGGGKYGILVIPALGGPEQKLLDVFMPEVVWLPAPYLAWLPDSKGIIYTNKDSPDHPSSLFLLLMESRETRRVTTAPEGSIGDSAPALSPDGSTLIFSRMAAVGPTDLYLLKLKADFSPAGECKRLTHYNLNGISASWTPDGRNIVFSHENWLWKLAISRSGRTSGEPHRLELVGNGGSSPAVSNQGRRLAYVFGHSDPLNIWRVGLPGQSNRGQRNQASTGPTDLIPSTSDEFAPTYSPDGKKIAFESERTGNLEIWTCQSDGSNCARLTFLGVKYTGVPHWSPDSQQIAFYSRPEGKAQIYVVNAEGGAARRLTNDSWENFFPVWSRDGRWIYFSSNRSGTNQIWKIPSAGGVPAQVTKNGGFACMESADSKYLYYTRANESSSGLFKMPVEGGPETKAIDAVLLHNFAVTARGVYYMSQPDPRCNTKLIQFSSFADGKTTLITSLKQNLYVGFSISPDERWLVYAPSGRAGSNVMLVEDFDADGS